MMDTSELRRLLEAATPGEWEPRHEVVSMGAGANGHRMFVGHGDRDVTGTVAHLTEITESACPETERQLRVGVFPAWKRGEPIPWHPDIRLIVAMRNHLPALLDRLDALERAKRERDDAYAILADAATAFAAGDMERLRLDLCDRYAASRAYRVNMESKARIDALEENR